MLFPRSLVHLLEPDVLQFSGFCYNCQDNLMPVLCGVLCDVVNFVCVLSCSIFSVFKGSIFQDFYVGISLCGSSTEIYDGVELTPLILNGVVLRGKIGPSVLTVPLPI